MRVPPLVLCAALALVPVACSQRTGPAIDADLAVPELPAPPGAVELEHATAGPHWGYATSCSRRLSAPGSVAEVAAFYARALPAAGWTIQRTRRPGAAVHFDLYKHAAIADIELAPRPAGGVEIFLERHDY